MIFQCLGAECNVGCVELFSYSFVCTVWSFVDLRGNYEMELMEISDRNQYRNIVMPFSRDVQVRLSGDGHRRRLLA